MINALRCITFFSLSPGWIRGHIWENRRKLNRWRDILGTWSPSHQNKGILSNVDWFYYKSFISNYLNRVFKVVLTFVCFLFKPQRFDELLQLASKGQHASVDMLVRDIYGGSYGYLGLTGDLIASSFGKSATADKGESWTNRFHLANL